MSKPYEEMLRFSPLESKAEEFGSEESIYQQNRKQYPDTAVLLGLIKIKESRKVIIAFDMGIKLVRKSEDLLARTTN